VALKNANQNFPAPGKEPVLKCRKDRRAGFSKKSGAEPCLMILQSKIIIPV
jgi:hypothetical protein